MNDLQIFSSYEFGRIRTVIDNRIVWFCGKDVAVALGYTNPQKAIKDHCKKDGVTFRSVIDSLGRQQKANFINESNLYRLIIHSKLPSAEKFEKWVFEEVLPSIRKSGFYGQTEDVRKWLATLIIQATGDKLEYLRRLYPDYLGEKPPNEKPEWENTMLTDWFSDISGDVEYYICSIPTVKLYENYLNFCRSKDYFPIGKKIFYQTVERKFGLIRRQKHDGHRYFCKK